MRGDLTGATDTELLHAVGRLEVDALGELYRRHGAAVFVLAHQLLGAARAEEATQDIFLYLWDHPDELLGMEGGLRSALLDQLRVRHLALLDRPQTAEETSRLTDESGPSWSSPSRAWATGRWRPVWAGPRRWWTACSAAP